MSTPTTPPAEDRRALADTDVAALGEVLDALFAEFLDELPVWERAGGVPPSAFERLGQAGVFAARWPNDGAGLGDVDVQIALAERCALTSVGAGLCFGIHCDTFLTALRRAPVGATLLDDALAGRVIGALAISERASGSDITACATTARRHGEGYVVQGHKHYVTNAPAATHCTTLVRTGEQNGPQDLSMVIVPMDDPGVRVTPHDLLGARVSGTCMVDFDEVHVAESHVVGVVGGGLGVLMSILRLERFWGALGLATVAELCLECALAFAAERQIGGRPLREHQVTVHRLAELASQVAMARALVRDTAEVARSGRLTLAHASQAKLMTARIAQQVADEALQMLGGAGYTSATAVGRLWADVRVARIAGGTDEVLKELIGNYVRPGRFREHPTVRAVAEAARDK
jgi:citronellyl-CoA dehydrogenase